MENLASNSEEILTDVERDNILSILFEGKEGELNASSFLYKGKGAELYEKVSSNEDYPFTDIEIEVLERLKNDSKFKNVLEKTEFITDVGSGDGQKAITLLKGTGWTGTYIAEDPSEDMLKITKKNLVNHAPEIKCGNFQVLNDQIHLSSRCPNNMYLFLGGTIGNMSDEYIIEELKNMDNNGIINGNKILLSYFTAPETKEDIDKLIKIYSSRADRAFHENGIDMLGLSRDDFEYDVIYELEEEKKEEGPFPGKIKGIIRAKRDCIVQLSNGREINIGKGKEFTLHYSRRFTKKGIEELFKKSGCKTEFAVDKEGESIVLLSKKPTKIKTFVKKNKKLLLATLAAGLVGSFSGVAINQHNVNKQKQRQEESKREFVMQHDESIECDQQKSLELSYALRLDELNNEKDKQTIISLYNKYLSDHKESGVPTERSIIGFYNEYGWILINNFGVTHEPYDFFGLSRSSLYGLVVNSFQTTKEFELKNKDELSLTPMFINDNKGVFESIGGLDYGVFCADIVKEKGSRSDTFEYKDGGSTYLILKVKKWENGKPTCIYVGAENNGQRYPEFSTKVVNQINDKSGLDSEIVLNTIQLGNFDLVGPVDNYGHQSSSCPLLLENSNKDMIIETTKLNYHHATSYIPINKVYVGGKLYYTVMIPTRSGKNLGLASTSTKGPFTTTEFNKMAGKLYKNARNIDSYY